MRNTDVIAFIGLSTAGSAVNRLFPGWAGLLARDIELRGIDLPPRPSRQEVRSLLVRLMADTRVAGAVVTGHKTAIYEHAADLLSGISLDAALLREASVLVRDGKGLRGTVVEPRSIAQTIDDLSVANPLVSPGSDVVLFGAGGAGLSLLVCLARRAAERFWDIGRVMVIDTDRARLERAVEVATSCDPTMHMIAVVSSGELTLGDLVPLTSGTLFVNATGLGKDRPGSPVRLPVDWPADSKVWDFNYRGDLSFLDEAAKAIDRGVLAYNGWRLFTNGWAESLAEILGAEGLRTRRSRFQTIRDSAMPGPVG